MRKRVVKALALVFIIALLGVFLLSACKGEKSVSSIRIVEGSFKESYLLDEKLTLTNAKIAVTYTDGSTENKPITADMVSGFDTSRTTTSAKLTVTYKGASVNFLYKVINSVSIDTSFRLALEVKEGTEHAGYDVSVKASGAETVAEGIYCVRFTVASATVTLSNPKLAIKEGYGLHVEKLSVGSIVLVLYSLDGYTPLENGTILTLQSSKPISTGTLNIQNASMSNGISDFVLPATSITIGG